MDYDPDDNTFADNWTDYVDASPSPSPSPPPPPPTDVTVHDLPSSANLHDELMIAKGAGVLTVGPPKKLATWRAIFLSPSTSCTTSGSTPPSQLPRHGPMLPTPTTTTKVTSLTTSTVYAWQGFQKAPTTFGPSPLHPCLSELGIRLSYADFHLHLQTNGLGNAVFPWRRLPHTG